jgi:hypothetical protein
MNDAHKEQTHKISISTFNMLENHFKEKFRILISIKIFCFYSQCLGRDEAVELGVNWGCVRVMSMKL